MTTDTMCGPSTAIHTTGGHLQEFHGTTQVTPVRLFGADLVEVDVTGHREGEADTAAVWMTVGEALRLVQTLTAAVQSLTGELAVTA